MLTRKQKFLKYFSVLKLIAERLHEQEQTFIKEMERRRNKPILGVCCNCVYGDFDHYDDDPTSNEPGKCRRRPPRMVVLPGDLEDEIRTDYPAVDVEDWCGEHRSSL